MSTKNPFQPLALTYEELTIGRIVALFSTVYGVMGDYEIKSPARIDETGRRVIDVVEFSSDHVETRSLADLGVVPYSPNGSWNDTYCLIGQKYRRMMPNPLGEEAMQDSLEALELLID